MFEKMTLISISNMSKRFQSKLHANEENSHNQNVENFKVFTFLWPLQRFVSMIMVQ